MGAETVLIGPKELVSSRPGPFVKYDLDAELPKLDVCYMLRLQSERRRYITDDYARLELRIYGEKFGLTKGRMAMLPGHAVVMHPGPMNRGVEIDSDVADSPRSLIQEQVTNGVKVRAALLYWLLKEENGTTARGA
jgi:aspartate carbamoyltransferase catalytic subunit